MSVVMSPNPKRIKVFLNGNGTVTPGGVEENLGRGFSFGGNPPANRDDGSPEEKADKAK